jgi:hypothetical protein
MLGLLVAAPLGQSPFPPPVTPPSQAAAPCLGSAPQVRTRPDLGLGPRAPAAATLIHVKAVSRTLGLRRLDNKTEGDGGNMSNINVAGQGRALPFTGLASLPLLVLGAILSLVGALLTRMQPKKNDLA